MLIGTLTFYSVNNQLRMFHKFTLSEIALEIICMVMAEQGRHTHSGIMFLLCMKKSHSNYKTENKGQKFFVHPNVLKCRVSVES